MEESENCTVSERAELMTLVLAFPDPRLRPENFDPNAEEKEAVDALESIDATLLRLFLVGSKIQCEIDRPSTFFNIEKDRVLR